MFSEDKKWFKTIYKLYKKGKLEQPFYSLFDYYKDITCEKENLLWKKASISHYIYFKQKCYTKNLDELTNQLNQILLPALKDNFESALEKYKKAKDYFDAYNNLGMFQEDDFVDENSEDLRKVLIDYVRNLKLKM